MGNPIGEEMNIYRYEVTNNTASGSATSTTLDVRGGLLRQFIVRANTLTTLFRVNVAESNGATVLEYGYHNGEINDTGSESALPLPMLGRYNVNITNASPNDVFTIRAIVQE